MARSRAVASVRFQRLTAPEEFRAVEEVQIAAWGMTEEHPVPVPIQRAMADNGGLVLGAFDGARLVGFCLGFLGREGGTMFHYSHMTAVRPEFQDRHVGLGLKRFQREEVLRQGLSEVRWTFDPLRSRNAFFNLRRLGVQADSYRVNYYGPMGSDTNRGLRTDRLRVRWELSTAIVVERVAGRYPTAEQDLARFRACRPLVETESVGGTIRVPTTVTRPSGPDVCIEVPLDFDAVRARGAEPIGAWREATRAAFESALDAGYRTDDFAVVPVDGERRAFYLLSLRPPDPRGPER